MNGHHNGQNLAAQWKFNCDFNATLTVVEE